MFTFQYSEEVIKQTSKICLLTLGVSLFLFSCKKDIRLSNQSGRWIEMTSRADTISFESDVLILKRGKEMINGYLLPKSHSGSYIYKEKKDSISLLAFFSSSSLSKGYPFRIKGNRLYIGDFYQKTNSQSNILTFEKSN